MLGVCSVMQIQLLTQSIVPIGSDRRYTDSPPVWKRKGAQLAKVLSVCTLW
jgi:hypothetical protein